MLEGSKIPLWLKHLIFIPVKTVKNHPQTSLGVKSDHQMIV